MTPSARVEAAIEILDEWQGGDEEGLDRVLTRWGHAHRFAGSGDRRAIADLVYDAVRRMRSAAWTAGVLEPASGRELLRGSLMLDGIDPGSLFTGGRYSPAPLDWAERVSTRPLAAAPRPIRLDFPDWLAPDLAGTDDRVLEALRHRAPLDLRVNLLKVGMDAAVRELQTDGVTVEPVTLSPTALRVLAGQRRVAASRAFREGLVEVQDAASQAVSDLAGARPGETVLDLCAGGGGKTLALAAAMRGRGRLVAHDIAPRRIAPLPARADRAGAAVEIVRTSALQRFAGACDLVFVDAPCSGSGTWRRNPDTRWRLRHQDLERLTETQDRLLDQAASLCAPGGRILYSTCSILPRENAARIDAYLARANGAVAESRLSLTPLDGGDGLFATLLRLRSDKPKN
jgi:16S rRNA (cytosine967-C5)-methyltransferase